MVVVRCEVCAATFPVPEEHLATLHGDCPGRRRAWRGGGPGAELKRLLAGWPFYMTAGPGCSCLATAAQMDAWGPDECLRPERRAWIVGQLRAEAARRGLPFLDVAGGLLVRRAVANARRAARQAGQHIDGPDPGRPRPPP